MLREGGADRCSGDLAQASASPFSEREDRQLGRDVRRSGRDRDENNASISAKLEQAASSRWQITQSEFRPTCRTNSHAANAIIGFYGGAARAPVRRAQREAGGYLNDIFNSGKHLLGLINNILDLSEVDGGALELEPSRFDLSSALS